MDKFSGLPKESNAAKQPDALINRLVHLGVFTDRETIDSLLQMKEEARPLLIDLLYDDANWDIYGDHALLAPICVIHILSAMGESREAAEAVADSITEHVIDADDWITEDASNALSGFGAEAFEPISKIVLDRDMDEFWRSAAANALFLISKDAGTDFMRRSIAIIKKAIIEEESNEDDLARTLLASDLSDFKDPDSLDFIKSLFQRGLMDTDDFELEDVLRVYSGEFDDLRHMSRRDPLGIFTKDSKEHYRSEEYSPWTDRKLNGRNDRCPCGSGKKFKKCCMLLGLSGVRP